MFLSDKPDPIYRSTLLDHGESVLSFSQLILNLMELNPGNILILLKLLPHKHLEFSSSGFLGFVNKFPYFSAKSEYR